MSRLSNLCLALLLFALSLVIFYWANAYVTKQIITGVAQWVDLKDYYWAVFILLVLVALCYMAYEESEWSKTVTISLFVATVLAFAAMSMETILPPLSRWTANFINTSSTESIKLVGIPLVIGAGLMLFWFRLRWKSLYGWTEVLFACFIAWYQLPNLRLSDKEVMSAEGLSKYALPLVSASIYLIVRGLDNVHKGRTENREWADKFEKIFDKVRDIANTKL